MSARPPLPPGPFLVVGLARSGAAVAGALAAAGERVVGCDSGPVDVAGLVGVEVHVGTEGVDLVGHAGTVVKSPGVPWSAAVVRAALEAGVPVMGELEIGWRLVGGAEFVAVTGSNGKTTTVELLGHIHREAGIGVVVAGNVGTPVSSLVGADVEVVVCEASSFQLEDCVEFAPEAAVLLNVAEDHLDRHGSLEAYREAKLRVFARQGASCVAVVPAGFGAIPGEARRVEFGPGGDLDEAAGALRWQGEAFMGIEDVRLRGRHNLENAMAAAAVALARGLSVDAVRSGLATFGGVPHRLEEVANADGVLFVNDSKATNVASAVVGISSFGGAVHLILGGRGKGGDFGPLVDPVRERAAAVYLIGESAAEIREALGGAGVPLHDCGDLESAVVAARAATRPGEVVLLSPACASFDQFRDFEDRGDTFRELVVSRN